uniref:Nuclear fragile x mental retardation-interacting protein 1 n=1 Tax=Colletotrichum fructicola (strain Nara gc5) TaxID=1213859 RepID=L2FSQ5_COLFN
METLKSSSRRRAQLEAKAPFKEGISGQSLELCPQKGRKLLGSTFCFSFASGNLQSASSCVSRLALPSFCIPSLRGVLFRGCPPAARKDSFFDIDLHLITLLPPSSLHTIASAHLRKKQSGTEPSSLLVDLSPSIIEHPVNITTEKTRAEPSRHELQRCRANTARRHLLPRRHKRAILDTVITAAPINNTLEEVVLLPAEVAVVVIRLAVVPNTRLLLSLSTSTVVSSPIPNTALRTQVSPRAAVILPSSSGTTITPILRLSMAPTLLLPYPAPTTIPITLPKFTPILNMPNRLLTSQDTGLPSSNSMGNLTNILHHTWRPRARGGYGNDRGGSRAPNMSTPAPAAYGNEGIQHQVNGGYGQPYGDPRAQPVPYAPPTQYPYHAPPPAPHASGPTHEPHYKHDGHGGREVDSAGTTREAVEASNTATIEAHDNNAASGKKKKRKTNTLGLTPGQDSDSEDDEMEEETLRKLIGADALQVTDVAAYIAERKKRFPTAARVKAKKSAEVAHGSSHKFAAALEKEEYLAIKLRKQLEKVESSIKRKREQQDEGDEMRDSSPVEIKSEDDEPEVASSRAQQAPPPPPPAKKADVTKHCKYYSTGGTCGKKGKCRFVHDPAVREAAMKEREANNGALTIQQRLILNDKDQEDLTVLQSIQYLREKGLMKDEEQSTSNGTNGHHAPVGQKSSLPAAPASLPPPPMKHHNGLPPHNPPPSSLSGSGGSTVRYKGWNLSGYGNSGLKSEDLP